MMERNQNIEVITIGALGVKILCGIGSIILAATITQGVGMLKWSMSMDHRMTIQETKIQELPEVMRELKTTIQTVSNNFNNIVTNNTEMINNNKIKIVEIDQSLKTIQWRLDLLEGHK